MVTIILRVPKEILDKLDTSADSVNTAICKVLAAHAGLEYEVPKRGGRRIPSDLTPEEIKTIVAELNKPDFKHLEERLKAAKPTLADLELEKYAKHKATQPTLKNNMESLAQQGYPYAEQENGQFTGKLATTAGYNRVFVGTMTLAEFQRRAGKKAFIE
jgi:NifB/MoaA-like Fe-S oxidoreductase